AALVDSFASGRDFYLAVMGEGASEHYTTDVLRRLFDAEGDGSFTVRANVVGHVQQGGAPSPFDRINATRLAWSAVRHLDARLKAGEKGYWAASASAAGFFAPLRDITDAMDWENHRPREQWWMELRPVFHQLSR